MESMTVHLNVDVDRMYLSVRFGDGITIISTRKIRVKAAQEHVEDILTDLLNWVAEGCPLDTFDCIGPLEAI